jgi:hypothetical protein
MHLRMFTTNDIQQLSAHGITLESAERQIGNFIDGFPFIQLEAPATIGNGIVRLEPEQVKELAASYEKEQHLHRIEKFVPASGAATRMFKDLFDAGAKIRQKRRVVDQGHLRELSPEASAFFSRLHDFAFYDSLCNVIERKGNSLDGMLKMNDYEGIIHSVLDDEGLGYASLPKGLLAFHKDPPGFRTPVDEHLIEGAFYCKGLNDRVAVHFTVSPEHLKGFKELVDRVVPVFQKKYDVIYEISFSVQKPSTDTIAVDMNNEPFRNPDGSLFFRPAGHGALIGNLNDVDADLIFIKNIDNVVPDNLKPENNLYKKALGGYLLHIRKLLFHYLEKLEQGSMNEQKLSELELFAEEMLFVDLDHVRPMGYTGRLRSLGLLLNRPMRICGMVKNVGEPGGGPFWVKNNKGEVSLQIVESSQVNMADHQQRQIFHHATHFNPVDLVCGVTGYHGNKFDLHRFIDHSTGFISVKSKDGRELKAQELPGLWNGSMAGWLTIFVEVPLITFNPVKTVNDLLRKEHQF